MRTARAYDYIRRAVAPVQLTAGPFRSDEDGGWDGDDNAASDGSFRFYIETAGVYRARIANPSSSDSRTVTFAWLKGASRPSRELPVG